MNSISKIFGHLEHIVHRSVHDAHGHRNEPVFTDFANLSLEEQHRQEKILIEHHSDSVIHFLDHFRAFPNVAKHMAKHMIVALNRYIETIDKESMCYQHAVDLKNEVTEFNRSINNVTSLKTAVNYNGYTYDAAFDGSKTEVIKHFQAYKDAVLEKSTHEYEDMVMHVAFGEAANDESNEPSLFEDPEFNDLIQNTSGK